MLITVSYDIIDDKQRTRFFVSSPISFLSERAPGLKLDYFEC
jgi:hypothetical protein